MAIKRIFALLKIEAFLAAVALTPTLAKYFCYYRSVRPNHYVCPGFATKEEAFIFFLIIFIPLNIFVWLGVLLLGALKGK